MTEEVIVVGVRTIGFVRDYGAGFEAWTADKQALGKFPVYEKAIRAVFEHDLSQREGAGR